MSALDELIPRYYKGFDMNIIKRKIYNDESLTDEEERVYCEALDIFMEKHFEENRKRWETWKKEHPGEYRTYKHPSKKTNE